MELKKTKEAASILGISVRTINNMYHEGKFPNAHGAGKSIRIPLGDIEAAKQRPWLKKEGAEVEAALLEHKETKSDI